jgi:hypothetical protein
MVEYFKTLELALYLGFYFLNTLLKNRKRGIGLIAVNQKRR